MSISNYGIAECFRNAVYVLKTRILIPKARMIRFPVVIRGKKYIDFGHELTTGGRCRIEVHGEHSEKKLTFGNRVNIGYDVRISCCERITIGNNVLMGSRVLITDNCHGSYTGTNQDTPLTPPNERQLIAKAVTIGNNVWIGENAVIQMGVNICDGCIIAANSVVTHSIDTISIVGGVPARMIKIFDEEQKRWIKVKE